MKLSLAVKPHMPFLRNFFVDINVFFKKTTTTYKPQKNPQNNTTPNEKTKPQNQNYLVQLEIRSFM